MKQKRAPPPGASSTQICLAVGLDEGLGDRQSHPGAARGPAAVEHAEDVGPFGSGHARALVRHRHLHQSVVAEPRRDRDGGVRRGVAGGVVEEVGEHLADQEVIDVDEREVVVDRQS